MLCKSEMPRLRKRPSRQTALVLRVQGRIEFHVFIGRRLMRVLQRRIVQHLWPLNWRIGRHHDSQLGLPERRETRHAVRLCTRRSEHGHSVEEAQLRKGLLRAPRRLCGRTLAASRHANRRRRLLICLRMQVNIMCIMRRCAFIGNWPQLHLPNGLPLAVVPPEPG